jgi:transposase
MVTQYMFNRVRQLKALGMSERQIAKELKLDRKTVAKYIESNAPPKYGPRRKSGKVDPFAKFEVLADSLLAKVEDLTAAEIFVAAKEEGYQGCERTVERRVGQIKGRRPKERFFEQEYEPGEQSQFDFKESVTVPFLDGPRLIHLHFGTLPFSDFYAIKGFGLKTYEAFMDGVHSFFESAGGMTANIRFDNLAPCVRRVLAGNERLYTPAFEKAAAYYGFGLLPCAPAKGSDKGDVEREIRTHARRLLNLVKISGRTFRDFDDLNTWLADYCAKYLPAKTAQLLEEERKHLNPLPPRDDEVLCKVKVVPGSKHGTITIAKTPYSIPDEMIGVPCRIVASAYEVKIFRVGGGGELAYVHQRIPEGSKGSISLAHVLPSLLRKPGAMVRWAHKELLFPAPIFKRYYAHLKRLGAHPEREYLRALNLIQHTTLGEIGAGMELVIEADGAHPFEDLKDVLLGEHRPTSPLLHLEPIRPQLSIYDSLIPQLEETGT